jgi:hypothetical protein
MVWGIKKGDVWCKIVCERWCMWKRNCDGIMYDK